MLVKILLMKTKLYVSLALVIYISLIESYAIEPGNVTFGCDIYSELAESPYFGEKVATFVYEPGIRVHINAPAKRDFDREKRTGL